MAQPLELWNSFCSNFHQALTETPADDLLTAWASHPGRTTFYRRVLQNIAGKMELSCRGELFKVDFAMSTKESDNSVEPVPIVFIETENNAFSCHKEIRKLASITAPLKILVAVVEWDETPGVWSKGSRRKELLDEWQGIIRHYDARWPRSGLIGIVVGERRPDNLLCFHACALTSNGELIATAGDQGQPEIHRRIFSKKLDWQKYSQPQ